jgi:hypothetical protein
MKLRAAGWATVPLVALILWVVRASGPARRAGPDLDPAAGSIRTEDGSSDLLGTGIGSVPPETRAEARAIRRELAIHGKAILPGDEPCRSGLVFGWDVGRTPRPEEFRALGNSESGILVAPLQPDGSFQLSGLAAGRTYTLSAVAPGATCVERLSAAPNAPTGITLRLMYTYGLAIRLEEFGGGRLRTAPGLFGEGPRASSPLRSLLENPPELQALAILGLEPGPGTRDRWQYLAVSDAETARPGPILFEVEVPGYRRKQATLWAERLVDRLAEARVPLEPACTSWADITVEITGLAQAAPLGLDPDHVIGSVILAEEGRSPVAFAVHARAPPHRRIGGCSIHAEAASSSRAFEK